ncbi:hypothetical protein [Bradyrhizobium sp. JYMT SZCCT0428]|uniref:hypothetical protein n=1 Tax=Bradyrhizobium sp. JYMT SZCCT0428 TaxID=2807673 RepID=UPI001BAB5637|nr:hypothetical protein [Bradyrhizobium sp. JYMT SZCCT0428]MBR1154612.1 hypothetical protein [Bradyrhizobium sp. JYMT SZCCT0428]
MPLEAKTAFQLQQMIGELAGFDPDNIDVVKLGNEGSFRAVLIGTVGAVSKSRAQADIETACRQLRLKFRLKA